MTHYLTRFLGAGILAAAFALPVQAGPFNASTEVAIPSAPSNNFVQLKQLSGFTGQLPLGFSDGGYQPVGNSFNKLAKFRLSLNCPAGFRAHQAGIRIRGNDVVNAGYDLLSPGDVPVNQGTWQEDFQAEPWKFDAVVQAGAAALGAAGNNGPVYVSLDEELDSRFEFYGWCVSSDPLDQSAIYYDSAEDNAHLYPKTRVRYQVMATIAVSPRLQLKTAPQAVQRRSDDVKLTVRPRIAVPQAKALSLKAPGGCPYDCPPPAQNLRLSN
jgi:hypothetical protein